jgi:hypothetical protein
MLRPGEVGPVLSLLVSLLSVLRVLEDPDDTAWEPFLADDA